LKYTENHKKIEKVQMCATKLIHVLKDYCTIIQHLERLKLPTLKYCRIRGDMLTGELIKIHAFKLNLSLIQVLIHVAIN